MHVEGYAPEEFKTVTEVEILINGAEIYSCDLADERSWSCTVDIPEDVKRDEKFDVEIAFNGANYPETGAADQRVLSGLINKIVFE